MPAKLLILTHGIGTAAEGFHNEWKDIIAESQDLTGITVKGLLWEDMLAKAAAQYDFLSGPLGELLDMCGFDDLKELNGKDDWKALKSYMMDVLVYVGLPEMWVYIQNECARKLDALRRDENGIEKFKKSETVLLGHSLGAAMLPHLVWREYAFSGAIAYRGMLLLASPLAFVTPKPNLCQDFLLRMGEIYGGDRMTVLGRFARVFNKLGPGSLRFINNENDIVCSDVKFPIPLTDQVKDLIPLRQGFDPMETNLLNLEHPGCVQTVSFGKRDPREIGANHDVKTYLRQPACRTALKAMLA